MKNKSHKRVIYTRINPLSVSLALVIALLWLCSPNDYGDEVYVAEPEIFLQPVVVEEVKVKPEDLTKEDIKLKIKEYFPRSHKTMVAIAYAESNLNPNAQGFNCFYNKDETVVYPTRVKGSHSTACKPAHRVYAYSTDCNVLQKNVKGQVCPKQTLDEHLQEVAELSKVQGLSAWSSFKQGKHLKYLTQK